MTTATLSRLSAGVRTGVGALLAFLALVVAPAFMPAAQAQTPAGQVSQVQGLATAQQGGGEYRFLMQGDAVLEGDTLSTTERGFAVVTLNDGSKFTLRPSTSFTLERFRQEDEGEQSVWLRLLSGGVRAVTGLIGKRNPAGVSLRTPVATIGIRGTSFDARLCAADCRAEAAGPGVAAPSAVPLPVVARVVQLTGHATVFTQDRISRALALGGALFEGEELRTGAGATVVLGFRDRSVVSVEPNTVLRISAFSFEQPDKPDSFALGLLRGGLRALTGAIGRQAPEAVKIRTLTSTIGVRGTEMNISCAGPCSGEPAAPAAEPGAELNASHGLFMLTLDGTPYFERGPLDVPLGQVGFIGADGLPQVLRIVPGFMQQFASPRPSDVPVDWIQLFASIDPAGADGLYVYVRDGHVYVRSGDSVVDLGPGEAGWSGREGQARRISPVPAFLQFDPTPLPEQFSQSGGTLLELFRVTLGQSGDEICRI